MHVSALRAGLCASLFMWLSPFVAAQDPHAEFRRGVAALHNFEYEDANAAFQRTSRSNPGFAMAYWGEAMTYHQTLWRNEDVAAARARPGPPRADAGRARGRRPRRRRNAALLAAVERLFGDGDAAGAPRRVRRRDGARSTRAIQTIPTSRRSTRSRCSARCRAASSATWTRTRGTAPRSPAATTQTRVAEILERVLQAHPEHPARSTTCCTTTTTPRTRGWRSPAARTLRAGSRPSRAMRGTCRRTSFSSSACGRTPRRRIARRSPRPTRGSRRKGLPPAMRSYHALSWLQYELLQLGRYREAWATHRRDRAGGQGERRPRPAERPGVDARALCGRDAPLGCAGQRAQLRQRQRAVRHRRQRRALGQRAARGAGAPGAGRPRRSRRRRATCGRPSPSWSGRSRP